MSAVKPKRLGDIITFKRGYDLPEKDRVEGEYPVISSAGTSGHHNEYKVEGEGVVTGRYGTLGKMYFVEGKYWPHNTSLYVKDFKGNDPKYIYYLLNCIGRIRTSDKSAVPGVNRNELHEMAVPAISDKSVQISVREVLSIIDRKIQLNNKLNTELEAMAKLIYDYWFVQFNFPDASGKPYKSSGGPMAYNDHLKCNIPAGWICGSIDDVADLVRGVTYSKDDIKSASDSKVIPILRATNITGNEIDLDNMVYVPQGFVSKKQLLNKHDVLITMSSGSKEHIGKNGMFYFDEEVSFGAFCAKLTAKKDFQYYFYSYAQSDFLSTTIKNECLGTNINNLNGPLVKNFKLPIPEYSLLKAFNLQVDSAYKRIEINQKENYKLKELRDWLLPMLMNGQVRVKS